MTRGTGVVVRLPLVYLAGLGATLFVGTIGALVLATRVWSPHPESTVEQLLFGIAFIATGLGSWAGLAFIYRKAIPVRCRRCSRPARASSLNPVTISCGACGHIQTLRFRVHGAR